MIPTVWLSLWLGTLPAHAVELDLNLATIAELAALEGVGPEAAARIVALREARGGLSSVEELRVLGLPEPALAALRQATHVELTLPEPPASAPYASADAVLAEFEHEPTILQVHTWAEHQAHTSPQQVRRWLRQSVRFATLPQVELELQLRNDWDQGFDYLNVDGAELVPEEEPFPVRSDAGQGQAQTYKVRLVWDLDKLVMSSERIRALSEARDAVELRDRVLAEVTRLYFERRRLQVERLLAPHAEVAARVREELRIRELTANLDALTGGAFSAALTPTR